MWSSPHSLNRDQTDHETLHTSLDWITSLSAGLTHVVISVQMWCVVLVPDSKGPCGAHLTP